MYKRDGVDSLDLLDTCGEGGVIVNVLDSLCIDESTIVVLHTKRDSWIE